MVSNGSACLRWLAGDTPNVEEAREAARRIVRDGKRAAEIISRIRALTRGPRSTGKSSTLMKPSARFFRWLVTNQQNGA